MRAIAACQFTLSRSEAWRRFVAGFTGLVVLAVAWWAIGRHGAQHWSVSAASALAVLAALALGVSLLQTPVLDLRWDGLAWHVGPGVSVEHELLSGTLSVSIDLGHWMLLRFQPFDARLQSGAIWIPVQRKGLEAQWHALRCAVYSPRPARDVARPSSSAAADF